MNTFLKSFFLRLFVATTTAGTSLLAINAMDAETLSDESKPVAEAITVGLWLIGLIVEAIRKRRERRKFKR